MSSSRAILVLAQGFLVFVLFETVLDFFSRPVFDLFILDSIWKLKGKRQIVALLLPDLRSMSDRLKIGILNPGNRFFLVSTHLKYRGMVNEPFFSYVISPLYRIESSGMSQMKTVSVKKRQ